MRPEIEEIFLQVKKHIDDDLGGKGDYESVLVLYELANTAAKKERDKEGGKEVARYARQVIEEVIAPGCATETERVREAWRIVDRVRDADMIVPETELYKNILLFLAQNKDFDSYLLYLEYKRQEKDRFYLPKRRHFIRHGIIQALQDMVDDKLDIFTLSMPPGTQKAQPLYSKVLTPSGFITMGEVRVGTVVMSGTGKPCNVTGVYPQGVKPIYEVVLETGVKCRCSTEHLWLVRDKCCGRIREHVVEMSKILCNKDRYQIPVFENDAKFFLQIADIQYIGDEECQCIYVDDPSHLYITDDYIITHNTTCLKFFNSAVIGWDHRKFNLFFSHSSDITRMYYDGVLDICMNNDEYSWQEIFATLVVNRTNAKMGQFNVGAYKPFPSLQTTSKGAENAGKVRCNGYLLVDDLIGSQEEALNIKLLDKLWDNTYTVDARQRKLDGCKEIHIATRWSIHDVIGRLQRLYDGNENVRTRFIAIPDIDEKTGESNFDYEYMGFTVDFFNDIALAMDEISYRALYKSQPIEREGLLYHEEDLRRFLSLPEKDPDAILAVCDVKGKGTDYMFLPVMYQYGEDFYLADCVCDDNSDYEIQYTKLTDILFNYKVQSCEFESNAGGDRVALEVQKRITDKKGMCSITTHPTETNKETRIIVNAEWVKKHVVFRDKSLYSPKSDYGVMMNWLFCYSTVGKNVHDDVPDGLANFRLYVSGMQPQLAKVEAAFNPFRTRGYM